jgi:predicted RND superfamily exporter protein
MATGRRKERNSISCNKQEAARLKFSPGAFAGFDSLLNRRYAPAPKSTLEKIRLQYFDDYITKKPGGTTVVTLVKVDPKDRESVLSEINATNQAVAIDRQMLTSMFVEYVNADFTFIVTFTSILVFVVLLISYGRIELTLITFIPMLIAWIWILGIMALLGIEFNIVNVMISTFIFGLGDDYSIFIMDGLRQEYKTGRKNLASYKTSILLSALTTIAGLGVLIFASTPR